MPPIPESDQVASASIIKLITSADLAGADAYLLSHPWRSSRSVSYLKAASALAFEKKDYTTLASCCKVFQASVKSWTDYGRQFFYQRFLDVISSYSCTRFDADRIYVTTPSRESSRMQRFLSLNAPWISDISALSCVGVDASSSLPNGLLKLFRMVRMGALGCTLAHWIALEKIAHSSHPYGIIFEDDAWITFALEDAEILGALGQGTDVIWLTARRFPFQLNQQTPSLKKSIGSKKVVIYPQDLKHLGVGAEGYIVSRSAAEKIVECIPKWIMSFEASIIDVILTRLSLFGLYAAVSAETSPALLFSQHVGMNRGAVRHSLRSAFLSPPCVEHRDRGASLIRSM